MMKYRRRTHLLIAAVTALALAYPSFSEACVGRKLVLGALDQERPAMVSRILSILIHERTGTTVEVKVFEDREKLLAAVEKGKVDLYVDHVEEAMARLKMDADLSRSNEERYTAVKSRFEEQLNLIWLKPMGYSGVDADGRSLGPAATVVRKETLKKFPALPRLLEKIGTRVMLDDGSLDALVERARGEKAASVARDYLKEVKLI